MVNLSLSTECLLMNIYKYGIPLVGRIHLLYFYPIRQSGTFTLRFFFLLKNIVCYFWLIIVRTGFSINLSLNILNEKTIINRSILCIYLLIIIYNSCAELYYTHVKLNRRTSSSSCIGIFFSTFLVYSIQIFPHGNHC